MNFTFFCFMDITWSYRTITLQASTFLFPLVGQSSKRKILDISTIVYIYAYLNSYRHLGFNDWFYWDWEVLHTIAVNNRIILTGRLNHQSHIKNKNFLPGCCYLCMMALSGLIFFRPYFVYCCREISEWLTKSCCCLHPATEVESRLCNSLIFSLFTLNEEEGETSLFMQFHRFHLSLLSFCIEMLRGFFWGVGELQIMRAFALNGWEITQIKYTHLMVIFVMDSFFLWLN